MRMLMTAALALCLASGVFAPTAVQAQIEIPPEVKEYVDPAKVKEYLDPSQLQGLTTEQYMILAGGAVAGAAVVFGLLEVGLFPGVQILGLSESVIGPAAGAVAGAFLTKIGYIDKKAPWLKDKPLY